ncbi:unnamed protein product [Arabidopsis halleri]
MSSISGFCSRDGWPSVWQRTASISGVGQLRRFLSPSGVSGSPFGDYQSALKRLLCGDGWL